MLELGLEGSYDEQTASATDRRSWIPREFHYSRRSRRFEEVLGFSGDGTLFGPQWLDFTGQARFGLSQERHRQSLPGPDDSADPHGQLLEYNLDLTFLPRGRLSGNAFAQRLSDRVPRTFLPGLDRSRERFGGGLYFNDAKLPMRLTFEHSREALDSRTRDARDDEQRGRDQLRYEATWQIDTRQSLRLEYEYDDRREEYAGSRTRFDTQRHYLTLNHALRFGSGDRSAWENLLRMQDEAGDLARDNAEAASRLHLQHTETLASHYRLQFLRDSFQGLTTETWRGEAGVTQRLGNWLTGTGQFYGLRQAAEQKADWSEWGANLGLSAVRENRWGEFSSNLSYNHAATDTRAGTRRGVVIAEAVTLRDPLPAYLVHTDVDRASIVVTDEGRTRTYLAGRDYAVHQAGHYTALLRLPSGAIPDRATVLVSYTYRVADNYDLRRDRVDFRVQQGFRGGLTPYYAASIQCEGIDRPLRAAFADRDINRHRLGTTYRQPRWSAGLEYEFNDDSVDPFQAVRANADMVVWQQASAQVDGRASASRFWFDGLGALAERDALVCDVGLSARQLLARDLSLEAAALYRYEDERPYGITHGVDLTCGLDWRIGYFTLRFEAEYDLLDLPGSRDQSFSFWIKLKREIPVVGGQGS